MIAEKIIMNDQGCVEIWVASSYDNPSVELFIRSLVEFFADHGLCGLQHVLPNSLPKPAKHFNTNISVTLHNSCRGFDP